MASQTALVIDDEAQIRRAVSHALADDFAKVVEAATGADGLRLNASEKPSPPRICVTPESPTTGTGVAMQKQPPIDPEPVPTSA